MSIKLVKPEGFYRERHSGLLLRSQVPRNGALVLYQNRIGAIDADGNPTEPKWPSNFVPVAWAGSLHLDEVFSLAQHTDYSESMQSPYGRDEAPFRWIRPTRSMMVGDVVAVSTRHVYQLTSDSYPRDCWRLIESAQPIVTK